MDFESIIIPLLTFLLGLLIGLFYKYADIVKLTTDVETLKTNQVGIVAMAGDVKVMRESMIFKTEFQQMLSTVCSEHGAMKTQIDVNTNRLSRLEAKQGGE